MYERGDKVHKGGGDYTFDGTVIAVFEKLSGKIRYAVEDDRGIIHIFSESNLQPWRKTPTGAVMVVRSGAADRRDEQPNGDA